MRVASCPAPTHHLAPPLPVVSQARLGFVALVSVHSNKESNFEFLFLLLIVFCLSIIFAVQGTSCVEGSARLVNGDRNNTGRVEVCRYGLWGTVCDTDWNATMANVACLQIGYPNGLGKM